MHLGKKLKRVVAKVKKFNTMKSARKRLHLHGKGLKSTLGLRRSTLLASSAPVSASTYQYQPRPISSLM